MRKVNVLAAMSVLVFCTFVRADVLMQAQVAFAKGDVARGKQFVASYLSGASNGEAYEKVGTMFARLKNWKESAHYLEIAKNREPQVANYYFKLGIAYHQDGRTDEAVESFRKALSLSPKSLPVVLALGEVLEFAGDNYDARLVYSDAEKRIKNNAEIYRKLCFLNYTDSFFPAAINFCTKAVRLNRKDGTSAAILATTYYESQQRDRAFEIFKSAFKVLPSSEILHRARGLIFFKENSFEQAAQELGRAAALDPSDDEALIFFARSLYELERYDDARIAYFYASKLDINYRFEFLSKQKDLMRKNKADMAAEYQQTLETL